MVTDRPPRTKSLLKQYDASDAMVNLELPADGRLQEAARAIESAMEAEQLPAVRDACAGFLAAAADFYHVRTPEVKALNARPLRVREGGWSSELFGDYTLDTATIRIWTRTAVQKRVTSFGTFLSTLTHEFCHHLDVQGLGFPRSPHTRGFYERAGLLYHHIRNTPIRQLVWTPHSNGTFSINWPATMRGTGAAKS